MGMMCTLLLRQLTKTFASLNIFDIYIYTHKHTHTHTHAHRMHVIFIIFIHIQVEYVGRTASSITLNFPFIKQTTKGMNVWIHVFCIDLVFFQKLFALCSVECNFRTCTCYGTSGVNIRYIRYIRYCNIRYICADMNKSVPCSTDTIETRRRKQKATHHRWKPIE